jgi:hypothetical protein
VNSTGGGLLGSYSLNERPKGAGDGNGVNANEPFGGSTGGVEVTMDPGGDGAVGGSEAGGVGGSEAGVDSDGRGGSD